MVLGVTAACLLMALDLGAAGQGSGAVSTLSANSFTFASEPVGTTAPSETLTLTNTGTAVLNIVTISIVGPDFSQSNTCGNSVDAGATCSIDILFDPIEFGNRRGTMTITSNAADSPQTVTLSGMGMGPAVNLSSTSLTFPSQLVTTTSAAKTVVVSSAGDEPLSVSAITLTGPFSENDTCVTAGNINEGATCSITVYFTPLAGGLVPGTITIYDNAYPVQQAIALSGTGSDFAVSLSPTSNSTSAGSSASYTVSVTPISGFSGTVTLGCGGLTAGVSCTFAPGSVTVSGSTAATSMLTVSTTATSALPPGYGSKPTPPAGPRLRILWLLVSILAIASLASFRRAKRLVLLGLAAAALLITALMMPACGGSKPATTTVTEPGTYHFDVTGTSPAGSSQIQQTATFMLVVN